MVPHQAYLHAGFTLCPSMSCIQPFNFVDFVAARAVANVKQSTRIARLGYPIDQSTHSQWNSKPVKWCPGQMSMVVKHFSYIHTLRIYKWLLLSHVSVLKIYLLIAHSIPISIPSTSPMVKVLPSSLTPCIELQNDLLVSQQFLSDIYIEIY